MQNEIISAAPLLDENGNLRQAGFAKRLLPVYRRADIKVSPTRIKEWDYYLVSNGRFAVAFTIDDNGYMGLDSVSLLDFERGINLTKSPMSFMPLGRLSMPESSARGDVRHSGKHHSLAFLNDGDGRRVLMAKMKGLGPEGDFSARIELTDEPEESMVICTPFEKAGHFYYNQKINCMRASGRAIYGGRVYEFDPADSFAVLDWGRGVWTYHNTWGENPHHTFGERRTANGKDKCGRNADAQREPQYAAYIRDILFAPILCGQHGRAARHAEQHQGQHKKHLVGKPHSGKGFFAQRANHYGVNDIQKVIQQCMQCYGHGNGNGFFIKSFVVTLKGCHRVYSFSFFFHSFDFNK